MTKEEDFVPSHTPIDPAKYEKSPYEVARTTLIADRIASGHGGAAIDIGCGSGHFTKLLSARGWRATAIDTDPKNIESVSDYATAHLGDAIDCLSRMQEEYYELALALEIIEHMPKTQGVRLLENIHRVLCSKGRLLISTPNKFSLERLGGYYWGEKVRRWGKWDAWDRTHVHIYSSFEFSRLLRATGFALDRVTGYHYRGACPLFGEWGLPFRQSTRFPFNRLGFNTIVECHKK